MREGVSRFVRWVHLVSLLVYVDLRVRFIGKTGIKSFAGVCDEI